MHIGPSRLLPPGAYQVRLFLERSLVSEVAQIPPIGSITHTDDSASAAVALTTEAAALGIDTECIVSESQARELAGLIAGQCFDSRNVMLGSVDVHAQAFSAHVIRALSPRIPIPTMLRGRFEIEPPWVHTGMALPPDSAESRSGPDRRHSPDPGTRRVRL